MNSQLKKAILAITLIGGSISTPAQATSWREALDVGLLSGAGYFFAGQAIDCLYDARRAELVQYWNLSPKENIIEGQREASHLRFEALFYSIPAMCMFYKVYNIFRKTT